MQERWSPTIDDAISSFIIDRKAKRCTPRTLEHYQTRLGGFATWTAAQDIHHLSAITSSHIRLYYIHLQEKNLSSHTVHTCARAIRAFLNFCVSEELLDKSPMAKVGLPQRDKLQPNYLTADEVLRLVDACQTERERAIVLMLLDTGLRATELCNLDGGAIDHTTGAVTVRRGKGRKDRTVFIGNRTRKQLLRYYRRYGKPGEDDPLFHSEKTGERLTRWGLRQMLGRVGRRCNVDVSPHKLRRTFATWVWKSGIDVHTLRDLMGHSDLTTLPAYLGIDTDDLRRAHDRHGPVDNL
ncbi:MAG: tyrosine-type recombinase/integrase [Caldilineaceae bacterium]